MRVDCYWNLHVGGYSIRAREGPNKGRVVAYAAAVNLIDARFHVCESMRLKTVRDKRRSVHAWVCGDLVTDQFDISGFTPVTYSPFLESTFVARDTREPMHSARRVAMMTVNGKASVWIG